MANYTRDPPKEVSLPVRLPLLGAMDQRGATAERDARVVNGYVERTDDGEVHIVKRPGLVVKWDLGEMALSHPAGMYEGFVFRGGDPLGLEIYRYYVYEDGALLGSYFAAAVYNPLDPTAAQQFYWCDRVATGDALSEVFAHNRYKAYLVDDPMIGISYSGSTLLLDCTLTTGSAVITTASTAELALYSTISDAGLPAATSIVSIDSATQFTVSANATATGATTATVTIAGPNGGDPDIWGVDQRTTAAGVADLNGAVYLMGKNSAISGSDRNDPQAWEPLNYLFAYAQQDDPIFIAKHLAYIVAFKSTSVEFFRDAGLPTGELTGTPLARVDGLQLDVGAVNYHSVVSADGVLFWASSTQSNLRSAWILERGQAREVAGPTQRRVLAQMTPDYTLAVTIEGHTFFLITDTTAGITLAYDKSTEFWSYWQALGETYFPFCASSYSEGETLLQHLDGRYIYKLDPDVFLDAGTPYDLDIYPPEFDAGMRQTKYLSSMFVIADQEYGGRLDVRVNDQNRRADAWTNWRTFDLGKARPVLEDCGSFTKRAFHFRYSSPYRCRLRAVELELLPGVL